MVGVWIFLICLYIGTTSIEGNTDSKLQNSCNLKCDLLQHINTLQQQTNQETLIRLGLDAQVQEFRKLFADVTKELQDKIQQTNTSQAEKGALIERVEMDMVYRTSGLNDSIIKSIQILDQRRQSTEARVTALQNENKDIRQELTALKNEFAIFKQTNPGQGKYVYIVIIYAPIHNTIRSSSI